MTGTPGQFQDEHYVPTAITAALPVKCTVVGHPFVAGDRLRCTRFYAGKTGMQQLNDNLYTVGLVTTDTFCLYDQLGNPIDGRNFTAFVSGKDAQMTLTGPDLNIENPSPPNVYTERIYPWL